MFRKSPEVRVPVLKCKKYLKTSCQITPPPLSAMERVKMKFRLEFGTNVDPLVKDFQTRLRSEMFNLERF